MPSFTFTLKIQGGNDAMANPVDVGRALERVAQKLVDHGDFPEALEGRIRDANGNTVGEWAYVPEDKDDEEDEEAKIRTLLAALADLNDGTGDLGQTIRDVLRDDPAATAEDIREVVEEAIRDAKREREEG